MKERLKTLRNKREKENFSQGRNHFLTFFVLRAIKRRRAMQKRARTGILILLIALSSCQDNMNDITDFNIRSEDEDLIEAINSFGFSVLTQQATAQQSGTIVPLNHFQLMGILLNASEEPWHHEMLSTLALPGTEKDEINNSLKRILETLRKKEAAFASTIWYKNNIVLENDFMESTTFFFNTEFYAHSFNETITQEVESQLKLPENTNQQLSLEQVLEEKRGILALHFSSSIHPQGTAVIDSMLFSAPAATLRLPSIAITTEGRYFGNEQFHFIEIPTTIADVVINLVIPKQTDNAAEVLSSLTPEQWANCRRESTEEAYNLEVPDFSSDSLHATNKMIPDMGTTLISEAMPTMDSSQVAILSHIRLQMTTGKEKKTRSAKRMVVADKPFAYVMYEKKSNCILVGGTFFASH
ncbi:MAG: serpin family protein [Bacteroidales bacterium]